MKNKVQDEKKSTLFISKTLHVLFAFKCIGKVNLLNLRFLILTQNFTFAINTAYMQVNKRKISLFFRFREEEMEKTSTEIIYLNMMKNSVYKDEFFCCKWQ